MTPDRELLEQALALVELGGGSDKEAIMRSIRARLEEDNDEPVAWYDKHGMITHDPFEGVTPLYTRPAPARKPLSEDEIEKEFDRRCELDCCPDFSEAVRWAEKMHGIGEEE